MSPAASFPMIDYTWITDNPTPPFLLESLTDWSKRKPEDYALCKRCYSDASCKPIRCDKCERRWVVACDRGLLRPESRHHTWLCKVCFKDFQTTHKTALAPNYDNRFRSGGRGNRTDRKKFAPFPTIPPVKKDRPYVLRPTNSL